MAQLPTKYGIFLSVERLFFIGINAYRNYRAKEFVEIFQKVLYKTYRQWYTHKRYIFNLVLQCQQGKTYIRSRFGVPCLLAAGYFNLRNFRFLKL